VAHSTGRPVGGIPDIQRHVHATLFNVTQDTVEDKRKAVQIGEIKANAGYYESLVMNDFARKLRAMDYGIRRKGRFFEIAGVSDAAIDKFSNRTKLIERVAGSGGSRTPGRRPIWPG